MPTPLIMMLQSVELPLTSSGSIAAIVISVFTGSGFAAILTSRATRRNLDSTSLKTITDATILLLDPMKAEIERLQIQVQKLSMIADEATRKLERALRLLRQHKIPWQD